MVCKVSRIYNYNNYTLTNNTNWVEHGCNGNVETTRIFQEHIFVETDFLGDNEQFSSMDFPPTLLIHDTRQTSWIIKIVMIKQLLQIIWKNMVQVWRRYDKANFKAVDDDRQHSVRCDVVVDGGGWRCPGYVMGFN